MSAEARTTAASPWDLLIDDDSMAVGQANTHITIKPCLGALSEVLQRAFDATTSKDTATRVRKGPRMCRLRSRRRFALSAV